MMVFPPVNELELVGVFDRGVPNLERIALRSRQHVDMSQFAILAGLYTTNGLTLQALLPANDHFFWFGNAFAEKDEWIFVYTGSGMPKKTTLEGTNITAYVLHWNKPTTLFADSRMVPALLRAGGILIARPPLNQPQLALTDSMAGT